ncbi:3'-5' exonuclease [Paenibacillus sp. D2_2]|uniref:3'-5' exonuclease n=1 Tax=Paenibacillus sp. D2_2 TaxID=3073092 RepID=UPI0028164834|nr:3'-5' exonuclease [Paenibacillus sp. D2_2]WMT42262.1 3'-5' exonuclease [Paenibacillus sp. D2_2]
MSTYIIFDLEFTVVRKHYHLADIIEIGAIKCREQDGTPVIIDRFQSYVKPSRQYKLTQETTPFTGITQEQVNQAPSFPEMLEVFLEWIGDECYYLCAWGPDDKYQLIQHCRYHNIPLDCLQNYNDIQLAFTRLHSPDHRQRFGLKRALDLLQLPFVGEPQRALNDAFNTAVIFTSIFPNINMVENNAAEDQLYVSELVYSTGRRRTFHSVNWLSC